MFHSWTLRFPLQGIIKGRFRTTQKNQKQSIVAVLQCAHVGTSGHPRPARARGVVLSCSSRRVDPSRQRVHSAVSSRTLSNTAARSDHCLYRLDGSLKASASLAALYWGGRPADGCDGDVGLAPVSYT